MLQQDFYFFWTKQVCDDIIHSNLRQVESTSMASGVRLLNYIGISNLNCIRIKALQIKCFKPDVSLGEKKVYFALLTLWCSG